MREKTFLVLLKTPGSTIQNIEAARARRVGSQLSFFDATGRAVASFPMNDVESWIEFMTGEELLAAQNSATVKP